MLSVPLKTPPWFGVFDATSPQSHYESLQHHGRVMTCLGILLAKMGA